MKVKTLKRGRVVGLVLCLMLLGACGRQEVQPEGDGSAWGILLKEPVGKVLYPAADTESGRMGYIDRLGDWVIAPQYTLTRDFSGGVATVWTEDGTRYVINERHEMLFQLNEMTVVDCTEGLLRMSFFDPEWSDSAMCFLDLEGRQVGEKLAVVFGFQEGMAATLPVRDGLYGYLDLELNWAISPRFEKAGGFSEGLAPAMLDGKYGYIDHTGDWVLQPRFDVADEFCGGYAAVGIENQWGVIDRQGNWLIEPKFGPIKITLDGIAHGVLSAHKEYVVWRGIWTQYMVGLIGLDGEWIVEPVYPGDIEFEDGIGLTQSPYFYKCSVGLDYDGNELINSKYNLQHSGDGVLKMYRDNGFDSWREDYPEHIWESAMVAEVGYMTCEGEVIHLGIVG